MRLPASMPASCISLSIFLQWLILLPMSRAMMNGFTTVVEAGKVNCFYENISDNKTLEIEYQVRQNCVFGDFVEILFLISHTHTYHSGLFTFGLLYKPTSIVD